MPELNRAPVSMLLRDDEFLSRAAAEAANPCAPGANKITVFETGEIIEYIRTSGASDLIAGDGSTWKRGSKSDADLQALSGDLRALVNSVPTDVGSWTPTLSWSGGGGSFGYSGLRVGRWYQVGALLFSECSLTATFSTLGTGNLRVGGLSIGQVPVAGDIDGYMEIVAKNGAFTVPYLAAGLNIYWQAGSLFGNFNYFGSSGYLSQYVSGLSGTTPSGDYQTVTWTGGSARLIDWQPDPAVSTQGRLVFTDIQGVDPTGTLSGTGWTASAAGAWSGARPGEAFLASTNFSAGQQISFVARGVWRVA